MTGGLCATYGKGVKFNTILQAQTSEEGPGTALRVRISVQCHYKLTKFIFNSWLGLWCRTKAATVSRCVCVCCTVMVLYVWAGELNPIIRLSPMDTTSQYTQLGVSREAVDSIHSLSCNFLNVVCQDGHKRPRSGFYVYEPKAKRRGRLNKHWQSLQQTCVQSQQDQHSLHTHTHLLITCQEGGCNAIQPGRAISINWKV